MLEMKIVLKVSAEELFERLAESLAYDIYRHTNKRIKIENIRPGYKYVRKMKPRLGKTGNVDVYVTEFEMPTVYAAKFVSSQGENSMKYAITQLEDYKVEVNYLEDYTTQSTAKKWNSKMMQFFYKRGNKKKIKLLLKKMEEYIISQRLLEADK